MTSPEPTAAPPEIPVVFIPSLGRSGTDYHELLTGLEQAGHHALYIDPPASMPGEPTLHALVADIKQELDSSGISRVHLVGHAYGNRLVRCFTADHPGQVASLTLLAAGGYVDMDPAVREHLWACFDRTLPPEEHLEHVRAAFFAPGNDPGPWRRGWMGDVARYQMAASERTRREDWWDAVAPHVLVIQGRQDVIAVPENGRRFAADHPEITTLVEIDGAGHALVPEQPGAVLAAMLEFYEAIGDAGA